MCLELPSLWIGTLQTSHSLCPHRTCRRLITCQWFCICMECIHNTQYIFVCTCTIVSGPQTTFQCRLLCVLRYIMPNLRLHTCTMYVYMYMYNVHVHVQCTCTCTMYMYMYNVHVQCTMSCTCTCTFVCLLYMYNVCVHVKGVKTIMCAMMWQIKMLKAHQHKLWLVYM